MSIWCDPCCTHTYTEETCENRTHTSIHKKTDGIPDTHALLNIRRRDTIAKSYYILGNLVGTKVISEHFSTITATIKRARRIPV